MFLGRFLLYVKMLIALYDSSALKGENTFLKLLPHQKAILIRFFKQIVKIKMYSDKFNYIENTIFYPGAVAHSYNPIIRKDERRIGKCQETSLGNWSLSQFESSCLKKENL